MKPDYKNNQTLFDYTYDCNGTEKVLASGQDSDTVVKRKMFFVRCTECCNIPVLHILRRKG